MLCIQKASGNSLAVQWLGLHASSAGGMGLIPGWGTKISHAVWCSQKKKKKKKEARGKYLWRTVSGTVMYLSTIVYRYVMSPEVQHVH